MKKQIRLLIENLFDDIYDLNNDVNDVIELGNNLQLYNYYPKNFNELRNIIEQLLEERGKDADLNDIDVSKVITFFNKKIGLFQNLDPHNIDISKWDVSNVEDMRCTFWCCENFNCNLSKWDVHNVRYMSYMFNNCKNFDGNGLENWKTGNCEDMPGMFRYCKKFRGKELENWDVRNVRDMFYMFSGCINLDCDLSGWDVRNVRDMYRMFDNCTSLKNEPYWYKN